MTPRTDNRGPTIKDRLSVLRAFALTPDDPTAIWSIASYIQHVRCEVFYRPLFDLARHACKKDVRLLAGMIPVYLFHGDLDSARQIVAQAIDALCGKHDPDQAAVADWPASLLMRLIYQAKFLGMDAHADRGVAHVERVTAAASLKGPIDHALWLPILARALGGVRQGVPRMVEILRDALRTILGGLPSAPSGYRPSIVPEIELLAWYAGGLFLAGRTPEGLRVARNVHTFATRAMPLIPETHTRRVAALSQIGDLRAFSTLYGSAEAEFDRARRNIDAVVSLPVWGADHAGFLRSHAGGFLVEALHGAGGKRFLLHILTRASDRQMATQCFEPVLQQGIGDLLVTTIPDAMPSELTNYQILRAGHNSSMALAKKVDRPVFLMCADGIVNRDFFRNILQKFSDSTDAAAFNSLTVLSRDMDLVRLLMNAEASGAKLRMEFADLLRMISPQTLSYLTRRQQGDGKHHLVPSETSHFMVLLKNRLLMFSPQMHVGALSRNALKKMSHVLDIWFDHGFVDRLCKAGMADRIYFNENFSEIRWVQLERVARAADWQGWSKAKVQGVPNYDMAVVSGMMRQSFATRGRMLALTHPLDLAFPGDDDGAEAQAYRAHFHEIAEALARAHPETEHFLDNDEIAREVVGRV